MAHYNREFLVPYLEDICALYLAHAKIKRLILFKNSEISTLKSKEQVVYAPLPPTKEDEGIGRFGYVAICCALLGVIVWGVWASSMIFNKEAFNDGSLAILPWIGLLFAVSVLPFVCFDFKHRKAVRDQNRTKDLEYQNALKRYEWEKGVFDRENASLYKQISRKNVELQELCSEKQRIERLLRSSYNANVIPLRYRDMYAAVYLYDWFYYSGADDLDHALSMYMLEEIKARLDRIIEQQSEMILNQRLMLAKQQESIDAQNQHSDMMLRKLNQLQTTEEERLRYERMNEANTAATAFFAAATYLKS